MIIEKIKLQTYPSYITIILFSNVKELLKRFKQLEEYIEKGEQVFAKTIPSYLEIRKEKFNNVFVIFNISHKQDITIGTIAHESCHATELVFDLINAQHDFDNPEPFTYLLDFVADSCHEVFKKLEAREKK